MPSQNPIPGLPQAPSVNYEDEIEKADSALRLVWEDTMQQGHYKSSAGYKHVHVLMLSWQDQDDDLKVKDVR